MNSSKQHAHGSKDSLCHQVPLQHPFTLLKLVPCAVATALQQPGLANHQTQVCQLLVHIIPVNPVSLIHWGVHHLQYKDLLTSHAVHGFTVRVLLEPSSVCLLHEMISVSAVEQGKLNMKLMKTYRL